MSDLTIKDGTGGGYRVGVTQDNRIQAQATIISENAAQTERGNGYFTPAFTRTLLTTDTEHPVLFFNPGATDKIFSVQRYSISVMEERPVLFRLYTGSQDPVANNIPVPLGNTNTLSLNQAAVDCQIWDGVGTGMTIPNKGLHILDIYGGRGFTNIPLDGSQIWGFGSRILITAECANVNDYSLIVAGWEEEL